MLFHRPKRRRSRALAAAGLLAWLACSPGAVLQAQVPVQSQAPVPLPNLGDSSDMSPAEERRLGDRIARELYRDPDYVDDPVIREYVDDIWQTLIAASRARGELPDALYDAYAWDILPGRDRSVNAFALPGGYFGLHLGLVAIVSTQDELASVLAHELSHVTQRHISRSMARQSAQAPWMMGAMILGILAAAKNPGTGEAMIIGGQAASAQSQLNYSRDMEREADRVGFNVASQAGYAPQGFVSMFEKLQQSGRLNDAGGYPYLRTHPLTTERIADMQGRVRQLSAEAFAPAPTYAHVMVAARANVLSDASVDALRNWQVLARPANLSGRTLQAQTGTLYGACLAAIKLRDFDLAEATLLRLKQVASASPAAGQRLLRMLEMELAQAHQQLARLASLAQGLDGSGRAAVLYRAMADVQSGRAAEAAQALQSWLVDHPRDAQGWQQLAQAHRRGAHPVAAVRAEAEAHAAQLDYAGALARMKAAQDLVRKTPADTDFFDATIVDTRIHQLEALLKDEAQER